MSEITRWVTYDGFGVAVRPRHSNDGFSAWGKPGPTTGDNAVEEAGDGVVFRFCADEQEAVDGVLQELRSNKAKSPHKSDGAQISHVLLGIAVGFWLFTVGLIFPLAIWKYFLS